ncbi:MAG: TusE/DsrC/DsvC family sulfur relay protein [Gammaproteobacteria bacterium]|nr:TusE/DsrC/DsvC family sulfur relay protein [Gammaproteobacteria bacterium]
MTQVRIDGISLDLRPDGHLSRVEDWNIDVARALAIKERITLTDAHWKVIDIMRQYYAKYNISPIYKLLKKEVSEILGADKASDEYLQSLFPGGITSQGVRIAGIPSPMLDAELEKSAYIQPARVSTTSPVFSEFEYKGKTHKVYPKGNLVNMDEWNGELAVFMAQRENITLTEAHWVVISFLRKFYFQYGITPMVRLLMKHMRQQLGDEKSSEAYLYNLFPAGPSRQGSRIAGLPEPQGCIDA